MKDVNVGEKDRTIRKLIEANRQLKDDLEREMERFTILENKHKDILVKFNSLAKESAKQAELIFSSTTGGHLSNYQGFLATGEHGERTTGDTFSKKYEDFY